MKKIVIFDPKKTIFRNSDTVIRHEHYAKQLSTINPGSTLTIYSFRLRKKNLEFQDLIEKLGTFTFNIFVLSKDNRKFLSNVNTVVFGEPFIAPTVFKILRFNRLVPSTVKYQIQFHGDFFDSNWYRKPNNWLRYILMKINIRNADSLRFVSNAQFSKYISTNPNFDDAFVAPIPSILPGTVIERYTSNRPLTIGYLGRITKERGLDNLRNILKIFENEKKVKFLIVGNGDSLDDLKSFISKLKNHRNIEVKGYLGQDKLEETFWSKIGVLVNTALVESYGLAMREAVIRNIPVISLPNAGAMELVNDIPNAPVEFYDLHHLSRLNAKIIELCNIQVTGDFFKIQYIRDMKNTEKLLRSWLQ